MVCGRSRLKSLLRLIQTRDWKLRLSQVNTLTTRPMGLSLILTRKSILGLRNLPKTNREGVLLDSEQGLEHGSPTSRCAIESVSLSVAQ